MLLTTPSASTSRKICAVQSFVQRCTSRAGLYPLAPAISRHIWTSRDRPGCTKHWASILRRQGTAMSKPPRTPCPSCLRTVNLRRDGGHAGACTPGRRTVYVAYRLKCPRGSLGYHAPLAEMMAAVRASPIPGPVPGDVPPVVQPERPLRAALWNRAQADPRLDFRWREATLERLRAFLGPERGSAQSLSPSPVQSLVQATSSVQGSAQSLVQAAPPPEPRLKPWRTRGARRDGWGGAWGRGRLVDLV